MSIQIGREMPIWKYKLNTMYLIINTIKLHTHILSLEYDE
jgi:hypothetical protein